MKKTIKVPVEAEDEQEARRVFNKYLDIRGYSTVGDDFMVHVSESGKYTFIADITDGYETK